MPSIFNTDKLKIMGFLSAIVKYCILSLIFITLMIDIVQSRPPGGTGFQLYLKGDSNVTGSAPNHQQVSTNSGRVFVTVMGADMYNGGGAKEAVPEKEKRLGT